MGIYNQWKERQKSMLELDSISDSCMSYVCICHDGYIKDLSVVGDVQLGVTVSGRLG